MPRSTRAKLFRTGGSQAVRLPRDFRLPGREVAVRRVGDAVVLEPVRKARGWNPEFVAFLRSEGETLIEREHLERHEREDIEL